jgi:hypothetical protein
MNRRSFFRFLGAAAATLALSEAIPFGRVWSFPSKIVVPETGNRFVTHAEVMTEFLRVYAAKLDEHLRRDAELWNREFGKPFPIGQTITLKMPRPYSARLADSGLYLPA